MKPKRIVRVVLIIAGILALVVAAIVILPQPIARYLVAKAEQGQTVQKIADPGTTQTLTILPLYEKTASVDGVIAGHGVSYLVRTDGGTILFDLGYDEGQTGTQLPLEVNMARLGITLADFDTVVISHYHPDHVGGTKIWSTGAFALSSTPVDLSDKRIFVPEAITYPNAQPVVSENSTLLSAGVFTTGTVPFPNPAPITIIRPVGYEQGLVVNVAGQGLVLITGCGHPGLEKMLERVRALSDIPVVGVVGGLHYVGQPVDALQPHIQYLKAFNPHLVALSPHDSDPSGLDAFRQAFPAAYQEVEVGKEIILK